MIYQPYSKLIAIKQWADRGLYDVASQNFDRLTSEDASIMLRILDHMHVVTESFSITCRACRTRFRRRDRRACQNSRRLRAVLARLTIGTHLTWIHGAYGTGRGCAALGSSLLAPRCCRRSFPPSASDRLAGNAREAPTIRGVKLSRKTPTFFSRARASARA